MGKRSKCISRTKSLANVELYIVTVHVCFYLNLFYSVPSTSHFKHVKINLFHSGIPSNIHTSTHPSSLTSVIQKKKKQQVDHSDWYNPTDLLHLCLYYTVTQVMTPDVFTEGREQGRGSTMASRNGVLTYLPKRI